jgi:23S rRNA (guanosine2251-2'-O)-methyltransferase
VLGDRPRRPVSGRPSGPSGRGRRLPPADGPSRPAADRGVGGDQVEGRQAVRELLLAGRRRVRELLLADDLDRADILQEIEELAADARVKVRRVPRATLEAQARSEAPQGVLARAAPLRDADFDTMCRRGRDGQPPFLLALDGITDPQNLGALLRTAECAGVSGVVLPRHRAAHVTPTVAKAAAGAIEHLDIALVSGLPAALARAKELGVWTVGLDEAGDQPLFGLPVADRPIALVLGAEGSGLARLTKARCDLLVAIPIRGRLPSLNVASAGALACYEVTRRRAVENG